MTRASNIVSRERNVIEITCDPNNRNSRVVVGQKNENDNIKLFFDKPTETLSVNKEPGNMTLPGKIMNS